MKKRTAVFGDAVLCADGNVGFCQSKPCKAQIQFIMAIKMFRYVANSSHRRYGARSNELTLILGNDKMISASTAPSRSAMMMHEITGMEKLKNTNGQKRLSASWIANSVTYQ